MQDFSLSAVRDVAHASAHGGMYIAGGTDVLQLLKQDVFDPPHLSDVLPALDTTVTADSRELRIGAGARMSDVAADPAVVRGWPAVSQSLLLSASPQVRNMATMGGNLLQRTRCPYFRDVGFPCNKRIPGSGCPAQDGDNRILAILGTSRHCLASHPSDLAVALVALDATLDLDGPQGARSVALAEFHREPGDTPQIETVLRPDEVIAAIRVPASQLAAASQYRKVRDRATFEWALLSTTVALQIRNGAIEDARVALGGVGTKPWRAFASEAALRGQPPTEAVFQAAAAASVQGAQPRRDNAFKTVLAQRTLLRSLAEAAA